MSLLTFAPAAAPPSAVSAPMAIVSTMSPITDREYARRFMVPPDLEASGLSEVLITVPCPAAGPPGNVHPMADLERAVLGRTGLEVTKLGYGAMELRGPA